MELSQATKNILEKAGWTSCRKIDIQSYIDALIEDEYEINDKAKIFLAEFGGLELIHPAYRVPNEMDKSHFDPICAISVIYRERVETYEERIGEKLIVIGQGYNEYLVLLISESGKIFGAYDDFLTCLGNNHFEALEAICLQKETPEIK
ncbi:SUKH-3 domain-containing protein [Clostridium sediminicola]|uniref:SUKH-3 domain-containing protein n=1 Tax=Clostridium sediminicola TaxID=3114879 RepID=UPI0031F20A49